MGSAALAGGAWSVILHSERLWVRSPIWACTGGNQPTGVSLCVPLLPSPSKINTHILQGELKNKNKK